MSKTLVKSQSLGRVLGADSGLVSPATIISKTNSFASTSFSIPVSLAAAVGTATVRKVAV